MKRICAFLVGFLLFLNFNALAQENYPTDYRIQYELKFSMDTTNLESKKTEKMYLFAGSEYGVFMNKSRTLAERRLADLKRKGGASADISFGVNNGSNPIDLNKAFFKNLQTGEVKVLQHFADQDYLYIENQSVDNWEIIEETKEIMGYTAQKATASFAGRDYEAWFTMEIPIPDGPYVFHGLPGLIVELYDTEDHYHFTLESIEKMEEPKVWELPKSKKLSKEKIRKLQVKIKQNALMNSDYSYMVMNTSGVSGGTSTIYGKTTIKAEDKSGNEISMDKLKRLYKQDLESQNNPMELE